MALRALAKNRGGIRTLFHQVHSNQILLDYANTRDVVYDLYEQILADRKTRKSPHSQAAYNSTAESQIHTIDGVA